VDKVDLEARAAEAVSVVMVGVAVGVAALCRRALKKMVETVETEASVVLGVTVVTEP